MALITKKNQNLVETQIGGSTFGDVKTTNIENSDNDSNIKNLSSYKEKSFFKGVLTELKKVKWPTLRYVITWASLMVVFVTCFSLLLGTSDHIFQGGIKFVDCTAPKGKSRDLGTCSSELAKYLVGINN